MEPLFFLFEEGTFTRIDAVSGQKTSLFDNAAIIKAYNTITSKNVERLPFKSFTYIDQGKKIRFMVDATAYIYNLASGQLISYVPEKGLQGVRGRVYSEVFSPDFKYRAF